MKNYDYPDETEGTRIAAWVRARANFWRPHEREKMRQIGIHRIYDVQKRLPRKTKKWLNKLDDACEQRLIDSRRNEPNIPMSEVELQMKLSKIRRRKYRKALKELAK